MRRFDIDLPPIVDPHQNLAPLRSAIGMMEQWNDGIMGSELLASGSQSLRLGENGWVRESRRI